MEVVDIEIAAGTKGIPAPREQAFSLGNMKEDKPAHDRIIVRLVCLRIEKIRIDVVHQMVESTPSREI